MKPFHTLNKRGQVLRLKRLAEKALHDFGMEAAGLTPLEHMANTTFRVDAAGGARYVMRIQTPSDSVAIPERTEDQVRSEMEWLDALHRDTDLVIPVPVRTLDNMLLTKVEMEGVPQARVCVLLGWVDGRFLYAGLTPKHLERVGVLTARLHEHTTRQFVPPEGFTRLKPDSLSAEVADSIINNFAEVRPREDVKVVEAAVEKVQGVLAALGTGPEVFGLIHADLHHLNYLFHRGEVRVIDFDDCGFAHFLYDLTVTLNALRRKPNYAQLRASLLSGYRSVRTLPEEHESYLDTLMALRQLQVATWFIEQRNHPAFPWWEEAAIDAVQRVKVLAQV